MPSLPKGSILRREAVAYICFLHASRRGRSFLKASTFLKPASHLGAAELWLHGTVTPRRLGGGRDRTTQSSLMVQPATCMLAETLKGSQRLWMLVMYVSIGCWY